MEHRIKSSNRHSLSAFVERRRLTEEQRAELLNANYALQRRIAEQARTLEVLRTHVRQLRLFARHSPAEIIMLDRHLRYLVVSDRWLESCGLSQQEIIGRSHYEVFPDIPERWKAVYSRCLAGAIERCEEDPCPQADGTTRWVRWEVRPWQDSAGEIGGIIIINEDITEPKQAEEALRESREALRASEQRYHSLYDHIPSMFFTIDPEGSIRSANRFGSEQLGYRVEELIGKPLYMLHSKAEKDSVLEHLDVCFQNANTVHHWEIAKLRKDGTVIWTREHAQVVTDANGRATALIVGEIITEAPNLLQEIS